MRRYKPKRSARKSKTTTRGAILTYPALLYSKERGRVLKKAAYERSVSAYRGVIRRDERLQRSVLTTATRMAEAKARRTKKSEYAYPDKSVERKAETALARYMANYKTWQKQGSRGSRPEFTY